MGTATDSSPRLVTGAAPAVALAPLSQHPQQVSVDTARTDLAPTPQFPMRVRSFEVLSTSGTSSIVPTTCCSASLS
jgi:hypothetical protein